MGRRPVQTVFVALADPTRRDMLERLARQGPGTATEIAAALPMTRQAVTKHLDVLREAGLVTAERAGRERRYMLHPEPLDDALHWMATVGAKWDERLMALETYIVRRSRSDNDKHQ